MISAVKDSWTNCLAITLSVVSIVNLANTYVDSDDAQASRYRRISLPQSVAASHEDHSQQYAAIICYVPAGSWVTNIEYIVSISI